MKKKNKVLLTLMGLVVLSGIAATSSTFAWFTTIRSATVSFSDATVETKDNDLNVAFKSSLNTVTSTEESVDGGDNKNVLSIAGVNKVTDISGDGLKFYKPQWAANDGGTADAINEVALSAAGDADGFLIDFTLTLSIATSSHGTNGLNVYLDEGTAINPKDDQDAKDLKAVSAARMAVIVDGAVVLHYAPEAEASYDYVKAAAGGTLYTVSGYDTDTLADVKEGTYFEYFENVADATTADYDPIAVLTTAAPSVDVTFRFWIEGEDSDAVNAAIGGVFKVVLNLYALVN